MKLDREKLVPIEPLFTVESEWTIPNEYVDDWGNHLNEADALKIYESERLKLFPKEQMIKHGVLGLLKEQHPRYLAQVYGEEKVTVTTAIYIDGARLYFLHVMLRDGVPVQDNLVEAVMIVPSTGAPTRIPPAFLHEVRETLFNSWSGNPHS